MSSSDVPSGDLTTSQVAALLRVSQATVSRIPKERLDYRLTPGGHRRYRRVDVEQAICDGWISEPRGETPEIPARDQRLTELERRIADMQHLPALVGQLQAELIELYSRTGHEYPGSAQQPAGRKRRTG